VAGRRTSAGAARPRVAVSLLKSRKFWLAVTAILIPILNRVLGLGLDPVEVGSALAVIATVIVGIAWEDAARQANHGAGPPEAPRPRRRRRAKRAVPAGQQVPPAAGTRPETKVPRPAGRRPSQARGRRRRRWVPISSN
jgi:hypothetical protein